jgi:hypothetical protein
MQPALLIVQSRQTLISLSARVYNLSKLGLDYTKSV